MNNRLRQIQKFVQGRTARPEQRLINSATRPVISAGRSRLGSDAYDNCLRLNAGYHGHARLRQR